MDILVDVGSVIIIALVLFCYGALLWFIFGKDKT